METQQKLRRIPSILRTSLGSCSSRTFTDVIHKSVANSLPRPSHSFRRTDYNNYPPDPTGPFTLGDVLKIRLHPTTAIAPPTRHSSFRHDWQFTTDNNNRQQQEDEEEDDEETESFFSSISASSAGSSERSVSRREESPERRPYVDVKDSFAVVKSSRDPYRDFRRSMVEMIVDKELFRAEELVKLLDCFLSLNSRHHHRVILEVFTEICEALIPHWS